MPENNEEKKKKENAPPRGTPRALHRKLVRWGEAVKRVSQGEGGY